MPRMGRRRKHHKNLPNRVYIHHGSYRYVPKHGPKVTLARVGDYSGMLRKLADVLGEYKSLDTMRHVFDRYELEVLPTKAETTQKDQARQLNRLRDVFGHYQPHQLKAPDAAQYRDARGAEHPTTANRELELLSHVCTMAVEWGAMEHNPLHRLRRLRQPARDRYVTDDEYKTVYELTSPGVQCVMDLALLTGLRRGDILSLTRANITEEGLLVQTSKTGAALLFEITPDLDKVIKRSLNLRPQVRQWIVCNRKGKQFTKNGFDSVWNRLMAKAVATGMERWQFKDLRRKSATDEKDEKAAQLRLGHTSPEITERVYRVKPKKVRPLR